MLEAISKKTFSYLSIITLFLISFRIVSVSFIFIFVMLVLSMFFLKLNKRSLVLLFLIVFFYCVHLLFGVNNYEGGDFEFYNICLLFSFSSILFFIIGYFEDSNWMIFYYSILSVIYTFSIVIYSLINGYPGYSILFDPFLGSNIGSPLISLLMVVSVLFTIEFFPLKRKLIHNIFLCIILTLSFLLSSVYLGSRASFLLIVLYASIKIFTVYSKYSQTKKLILLFSFLFFSFGFIFILEYNISLFTTDLELKGFTERGLESSRFLMFKYGFENFLYYPFGGMKVIDSGTVYDGYWFHNVYLDIVRVSGLCTLFIWCLIQLLTIIHLKYKVISPIYKNKSLLLLFLIISLCFSQDLVFDGYYNLVVYYFFIIGASCSYERT